MNNTAKYLLVVFIICRNCILCQNVSRAGTSYDLKRKYSVEQLQFDFAILREALTKIHPGLFWYQSEKQFEDDFVRLKSTINRPMTEREFYALISPYVANIRCSHTDLVLSEGFDRNFLSEVKFFPFGVRIINSKLYINRNYSTDDSISSGSEITSINGISADSILRVMKPHAWADGFTESYSRIEDDFDAMLLILGLFNKQDRYALSIVDLNGESKLIEVETLDQKILETRRLDQYARSPKFKPFSFHVIDSINTAVLKVTVFHGKGYEKFLTTSFRTLRDKRYKNLIIDLRGNRGGNAHYARLLYSYISLNDYKYYNHVSMAVGNPKDSIYKYGRMDDGMARFKIYRRLRFQETEKGKYELKSGSFIDLSNALFKPQKNSFNGNVFVLMDIRSSSATSGFCAVTSQNKRAIFVGRETGGGYCGGGGGSEFLLTLPNTGIRVTIPILRYEMAVEGSCGRGIKPDYPIKDYISDLTGYRDQDLLFTLDLIRRSK
jgi:hypothetical protein